MPSNADNSPISRELQEVFHIDASMTAESIELTRLNAPGLTMRFYVLLPSCDQTNGREFPEGPLSDPFVANANGSSHYIACDLGAESGRVMLGRLQTAS